jgi:thiol-disulfide isomerase/thioredoxin
MWRNGLPTTLVLLGLALLTVSGSVGSLSAAETPAELTGIGGEKLTEADLAEGATILVVWASWSPRCRDIGKRVERIAARWGEKARVATVNFQEDEATARDFARRQRLAVPVYLDRNAVFAKRHGVSSLPFLLVIENGETSFSGKLPTDADAVLERELD